MNKMDPFKKYKRVNIIAFHFRSACGTSGTVQRENALRLDTISFDCIFPLIL